MTKEFRLKGTQMICDYMDTNFDSGCASDFNGSIPTEILMRQKYHKKFDKLIPVWRHVVISLSVRVRKYEETQPFFIEKYERFIKSICENEIEDAFTVVVESLEYIKNFKNEQHAKENI